jgi:cytochrome b
MQWRFTGDDRNHAIVELDDRSRRELFLYQPVKRVKPKAITMRKRILVWDLPTRIFHWMLVILVGTSFLTGKIGGSAMRYHEWSGFVVLALLFFRVVWGFVGSRESRFVVFIRDPGTVFHYATNLLLRNTPRYLGHNPLGGWSIVAMLLALFIQAGTGLFANDDIATQGPLYGWVSKETSDWLTGIHTLNQQIILAVVGVHIFAVLFHLFFKRENLVTPMITGFKEWDLEAAEPATGRIWLAAVIAALAAIAVYLVVR